MVVRHTATVPLIPTNCPPYVSARATLFRTDRGLAILLLFIIPSFLFFSFLLPRLSILARGAQLSSFNLCASPPLLVLGPLSPCLSVLQILFPTFALEELLNDAGSLSGANMAG